MYETELSIKLVSKISVKLTSKNIPKTTQSTKVVNISFNMKDDKCLIRITPL